MSYPNGAWPDSELVVVQGSGDNAIRLNRPTAAAFFAMRNDYAEETHRNLTLVSSYRGAAGYRSKATQLDMRARPSLYSITPGIVPGLPSQHGDANCMDIDQGLAWVKKNGWRYGITFPLAFDHNHGRYDMTTLAGDDYTPLTATEQDEDMPKLIRHPNGSIGFINTSGELDAIGSQNEVDSLRATGLVDKWVQMPDGNVWNTLANRTARLRAARASVDPAAIAAALSPLLIPAITSALGTQGNLTQEQVIAATETAVRAVFADAATK